MSTLVSIDILDKAAVAQRSSARGRPMSASLAAMVHTATCGHSTAVDAAIGALISAPSDAATHKIIADATAAHFSERLRQLDQQTLSALVLGRYSVDRRTLLALVPDVPDLPERAVASGMVDAAGTTLAAVSGPLVETVGAAHIRMLLKGLLEYRLGDLDADTAVLLARDGLVDPRLAEYLCTAAHSMSGTAAASLLDAAVLAGADATALAPRRAEIAALRGNLDDAERCADVVLESSESFEITEVRTAVRVSATVAAERGMLGRSAALYEWLGKDRMGPDSAVAATVLLAAGHVDTARVAAAQSSSLPPTSSGAASTLLAAGLLASVESTSAVGATTAMNSLMRAVTLASNGNVERSQPDSGAAMAALLAVHSGDLARADSTVERALPGHEPGSISWTRLHLIGTWSIMLQGNLVEAQRRLDSLRIPRAHGRNQLFARALDVGLARRSADTGKLVNAWNAAQDVVAEYSVDLFALLPVGELFLAATRLGRADRITHLLDQADALLTALGDPPAWASALHWYRVQAAILAEQPAELIPHARALAIAAETYPYGAALAAAGRAWLGVLQGNPDAEAVAHSAQLLAGYGLPWDGARLASEAALRVPETSTATALLQVARSLRGAVASGTEKVTGEPKGALSEREAEVAELLVLGVTYKEVGSRLYISAKTVEHHVARIRRRLGASSRSELLSMLRAMGYGAGESVTRAGVRAT